MHKIGLAIIASSLVLSSCSKHMEIVSNQVKATVENQKQNRHNRNIINKLEKALANNNHNEAIGLYDKLSSNAQAGYTLKIADSYRLTGNCVNAIKLYDEMGNNLDALEGRALCHMQEGELTEASILFNKIINHDASRWRVLNSLGVIEALSNRFDGAMSYYNMALEISDKKYIVQNNIALSLAFNGRMDQAIKVLEQAIPQHNTISQNHLVKLELNLALFYGIAGKNDMAANIAAKYLSPEQLENNLRYYATLSKDYKLAKGNLANIMQ
jgi:Flp pilus assembly protein TadD